MSWSEDIRRRTKEVQVIKSTIIGRQRSIGALVAACAAGPAILLGAATAHADPNAPAPDPRAQCESPEVGGVFTAGEGDDGLPRSVCQYIVEGYAYYDNYESGAYTGTTVYRDGAQVPTERPTIPSLFKLPAQFPLMPF